MGYFTLRDRSHVEARGATGKALLYSAVYAISTVVIELTHGTDPGYEILLSRTWPGEFLRHTLSFKYDLQSFVLC